MFKPKLYNDGVVFLYREQERVTDFGAKRNVTAVEDMDFIVKMDYEELSKREQDQEFAQENGFSLSLKIRIRKIKGIDNKCKAVIDNYLYDVSYVDGDKTDLYLYLEGVRSLAN